MPDKDGEDVALGYDDVLDYEKETRISELPSEDAETAWIMQNFPSMEKNTSWKKMKARTSATAVPCYSRRMWDMELLEEENSVRFHLVSGRIWIRAFQEPLR